MKVIVWQCRDWCCEDKPFYLRWWNARRQGEGGYHSADSQYAAWRLANETP